MNAVTPVTAMTAVTAGGGALAWGVYLAGMVQLAWVLGCAGLTARCLLRRTSLAGGPRLVAFGLLGAGAVIATELLPLLCGLLGRVSAPIAALAVLGVCRAAVSGLPEPARAEPDWPEGIGPLGWAVVVVTGAFWLAALEVLAQAHVSSVDALSFHLPGVVSYLQSGSLWHLTQFIPGQAQANYPQSGDLLLLAVSLPFHSLALVRYVDPVLLALAALAAFEATSEIGVPRRCAAVLTLALFSLRPVLGTALPDSLVDPAFLLGFCAGLLFLVRYRRTQSRADLLLAGAGLALALSSKWYGLEDVPIVVICWAGWARPPWRRLAILITTVVVLGGVWMLRNWVLTGDPIFDEPVRVFGLTIFNAPYSWDLHHIGFSLAHYATHPTILRLYVWPVFRSAFGVIGAVLVLGALLRRRPWFLSAAALLCVIAYAVTPYTALGFAGHPVGVADNTRYAVAALILCLPLCGLALERLGGLAWVVELGLAVITLLNLHHLLPEAGLRLVLSGLILLGLWALRRVAAVRLAALVGVVLVAFHYQNRLAATPWEPDDPTVDYVLAHAPSGTRIGVAGTWTASGAIMPAPLYGPRLANRVIAVGPWNGHRLGVYRTRSTFLAALTRAHVGYLEVGNGIPPVPRPQYVVWAQSAGYRTVAGSARLTLLSAPGAAGAADPF